MTLAYYVEMPLDFPEGVHAGAGKKYNVLAVARDGNGKPVLNGSSLAGVMRSIWRSWLAACPTESPWTPAEIGRFFGTRCSDDARDEGQTSSAVRVTNYELIGGELLAQRTHHLRNRHRGTVVERGLYSLEACPPNSRAQVGFWIVQPPISESTPALTDEAIRTFLTVIVSAFQNGVSVGGSSNRGIGRAVTNEANVRVARFDRSSLADHSRYLDAMRSWSTGGRPRDLVAFDAMPNVAAAASLVIDVRLKIPRGQDILVADGQGSEAQMEPQRVIGVDKQWYWRIPGSSLRGLFRRWIHRLSAREQLQANPGGVVATADSVDQYKSREASYTGEQLGWCFKDNNDRDRFAPPEDWKVESLFGTCFRPGRLKITDGFQRCTGKELKDCPEAQLRMHVAVDRVTGGAAEGMLFDNFVLVDHAENSAISFRISVRSPTESDVRWLAQTLKALDLGLLRVGSSKSSGRLSFREVPVATGPFGGQFNQYFQ